LSARIAGLMGRSGDATRELRALRSRLRALRDRAGAPLAASLASLDAKALALESGGAGQTSFSSLNGDLLTLYELIEGADAAPTTQVIAAVDELQRSAAALLDRWNDLRIKDVPALNAQLQQAGLPAIDR